MDKIKKENFSKSVTYLLISQVMIKVLGLIYSLYLINKSNFGDKGNAIYLGGYQIFAFVLTFSSIGVPNAVSNMVAKCEDYSNIKIVFKTAILIFVSISCVSALALYFGADNLAYYFIGNDIVSYNLKILSPIVIASAFESIYIGYFNGIKQMKITAKLQFLEQLLKCAFTIAFVEFLAAQTENADILSVGSTLGVALSIIINLLFCIYEKRKVSVKVKKIKSEYKISRREIIRNLLGFSIPISFGAMLVGINKNIDSFSIMKLLSQKIGRESAQRIYGIIASKIDVLTAFPLAFNMTFSIALIPNISESIRKKEIERVNKYVQKAIYLSSIIGITSAMGLYFFSEEIFSLLFSNSKNGAYLLRISAISVYFSVMNQTFCGILQAIQKNKLPVFAMILGTICKFILNIVLVSKECFFEKGIIISTIVSNVIMFVFLYYEVQRNIKIKFRKFCFYILLVNVIMIIFSILLKIIFTSIGINSGIAFLLSMFGGGFVYLVKMRKIGIIFGFSLEKT